MIARLAKSLAQRAKRYAYAPNIHVEPAGNLARLGSKGCGWTFEDRPELRGSTIVSAGLGEDGSFDVEFAKRYDARVIIVDPTPRAIAHFEKVRARLGQPAERPYLNNGNEPVEAYDLSRVTHENLRLEPSALWIENTILNFFLPPDPTHVSHSIVNFQNDYKQDGAAIEVPAITISELIERYAINELALVKLDIEAAEIFVIPDMIRNGVRPNQILVEFDEMNKPSRQSREKIEAVDHLLRENGYVCRDFDGYSNYLYVLPGVPA